MLVKNTDYKQLRPIIERIKRLNIIGDNLYMVDELNRILEIDEISLFNVKPLCSIINHFNDNMKNYKRSDSKKQFLRYKNDVGILNSVLSQYYEWETIVMGNQTLVSVSPKGKQL